MASQAKVIASHLKGPQGQKVIMEGEVSRFLRIPGLSPATSKLIAALKEKPEEHEFTYSEISAISGDEVDTTRFWSHLSSARRALEKKEGHVWVPVRGERKIRRCVNGERAESISGKLKRVRKGITSASVRASTVEASKLGDNERTRFLSEVAQMGALQMVVSASTRKRMEADKVYDPAEYLKRLK